MNDSRLIYSATVLLLLWVKAASGADAPAVEQCPGASEWNRSHPALPGDRVAMADPSLLEELKTRVEADQSARRKWLANPDDESLARAVDEKDAANVAWLRELLAKSGFPKASQVGHQGVHLAWVLSQHADQDPKLQSDLLPVLEQRHASGELPANDLARSTDRMLLASGKPQRYGTQFDWFAGTFELPDPRELAVVDAERARLGLMPLADYVCTLRVAREKAR